MNKTIIDCPSSRGKKQWTQRKWLAGTPDWKSKSNHKVRFNQYTYDKPNTNTFYPFNIITVDIFDQE